MAVFSSIPIQTTLTPGCFKGTEDLGNGNKALFVLETSVRADEGGFNQGGTAFGRQTFVGLQGDAGTLTLGRQYTPYFLAMNAADPFASGMAGSALNLFPNAGNGNRITSLNMPHQKLMVLLVS